MKFNNQVALAALAATGSAIHVAPQDGVVLSKRGDASETIIPVESTPSAAARTPIPVFTLTDEHLIFARDVANQVMSGAGGGSGAAGGSGDLISSLIGAAGPLMKMAQQFIPILTKLMGLI